MPVVKLSEHFTLSEMTRSDAAVRLGIDNTPSPLVIENLRALCAKILEPVRAHFRKPVRISSGYRAPEVNRVIGGNPKGSHPNGEAADFEVDDVDNLALARWIEKEGLPFDQLILEFYVYGDPKSGWVHCSHKRIGNNRRDVLIAVRKHGGGVEYRKGLPKE